MTSVTMIPKRTNVVQIDLCNNVSYDFDTSNAKIEKAKIGNEEFKPANLVNILNGVSWILQKKDNKIIDNYNDARRWQDVATYWRVSYKRLRMKIFFAALTFVALGAVAFFIWGV